jgi:hypothetical protein
MPDYQNGKIYKIVNDKLGLTYYGSTTQILSQRMGGHIANKKRFDTGKCNNVSSFKLLDGNQKIYLVEKYPCNDKNELERRERYYIETNECVNKRIPSRTQKEHSKEYYIDNKDKFKQKNKDYRDKNKDIIKQYQKQYQKQYRDKNKDIIKQRKKQYRDKNKDKIKQYQKQYCDKNKDKLKEKNKQYYDKNKLKYLLSPKCIDDIFKILSRITFIFFVKNP